MGNEMTRENRNSLVKEMERPKFSRFMAGQLDALYKALEEARLLM
jgi:hypothetical protein